MSILVAKFSIWKSSEWWHRREGPCPSEGFHLPFFFTVKTSPLKEFLLHNCVYVPKEMGGGHVRYPKAQIAGSCELPDYGCWA